MTSYIRPVAALAALAALSACATPYREGAVENPATPLDQYRAQVHAQPEEVRLAVHARGVSAAQADALAALVHGWRMAEGGVIRMQAPTGGPDPSATYRMGESVRAFLLGQGVPAGAIELVGYAAQGQAAAPFVVGYTRYQVQPITCGQSWENLSGTWRNATSTNFGCAATANLAAQIANPGDLLGPRAEDPADATRRMDVLGKYREGELTSTRADDQARGTVSQVVR